MNNLSIILRWGWLLAVALFVPVDLPAGGANQSSKPQIQMTKFSSQNLTFNRCPLRATPFSNAPTLRYLKVGTPVNVLRTWNGKDGQTWLHIQISSSEYLELPSSVRRGWVNV